MSIEDDLLTATSQQDHFVLRLYVAGMTPRSLQAFQLVQELCKLHLAECHELEVIDIYQYPELARRDQIIAVPTLVKVLPIPPRRMIGDLADRPRLLQCLGLAELL